MPKAEFLERMDHWILGLRNSKAIEGHQIIIPGDPESISADRRRREGIPLLPVVVEDLKSIGNQLQIRFPDSIVA